MVAFTVKSGFKLYPIESFPVLVNRFAEGDYSPFKAWYLKLLDKWDHKKLKRRREELQQVIQKHKPELIFLDNFYYSDFPIIYGIDPKIRCVFLNVRFPSAPNEAGIPPSNVFSFPGFQSKLQWRKRKVHKYLKSLWKTLCYFGKSDHHMLSSMVKKFAVPTQFSIESKRQYSPAFREVEEWFLFPQQLDFPSQQLAPWQKYVPLGIDPERFELLPAALQTFVKKQTEIQDAKLIYCSLGSISKKQSTLSAGIDLKGFYQKIIDIAHMQPNWYFAVAIDAEISKALHNIPPNVFVAPFLPQLYLLKHAALMINHGGGSVNEAAYFGVPMLVFPINSKWDFNGNAARVVYHHLGLKASFQDSVQQISLAISSMLYDPQFKEAALHKANDLHFAINNFNINTHLSN